MLNTVVIRCQVFSRTYKNNGYFCPQLHVFIAAADETENMPAFRKQHLSLFENMFLPPSMSLLSS